MRSRVTPERGLYEDSVEFEMARLDKEMRGKGAVPTYGKAAASSPKFKYDQGYVQPPSPLSQAIASQMPTRHYIPRPASGKHVPQDIFGADVSVVPSYANNDAYSKPASPSRELRVQRRMEQEEYARQVAEAAERQPVGGLKRNVYLTGDSILDKIGGSSSARSPSKPASVDPAQQRAREDKRRAQEKYAALIRQDAEAAPISARKNDSRSAFRNAAHAQGQTNEAPVESSRQVDSKRESQRSYREQLDRDIERREGLSSGLLRAEDLRCGASLFEKLSDGGEHRREQQSEYARQIREASNAPAIASDFLGMRGRSVIDDSDEGKYSAFKHSEASASVAPGRRARSPVIAQNARTAALRDGRGEYSNAAYGRSEEDEYSRGIDERAPYYAPSYPPREAPYSSQHDYYEEGVHSDAYGGQRDDAEEQAYDRYESMGEAGYGAASRKVQDYEERQTAYAAEEAHSSQRHSAPSAMSERDARSEETRRRREQQAYARDVEEQAKAAPMSAHRVSLLRGDACEGAGPGFRVRGTSTGGGASSFRLG